MISMDDRHFDDLTRRVGGMGLPALPRRGLLRALGGAGLAGTLTLSLTELQRTEAAQARDKNSKCKKEGKGCDKKKCKKQDKKCCCNGLKCNDGVCEGKGSKCPTKVNFSTSWTTFDSASGPDTFNTPRGITTDSNGNVYVVDSNNQRILTFDSGGALLREFGRKGNENNEFQVPTGIGFNQDSNGRNRLLVTDPGQSSTSRMLRQFQTNGTFVSNLGRSDLINPMGIAVGTDDRIWVVDTTNPGQVFRFNADGANPSILNPSGNGRLVNPEGIAIFNDKSDGGTYVFVTDTGNNRVVKYQFVNSTLAFRVAAGSSGSGSQQFNSPAGIAVDKCGNVWVADRLNDRIQILDKDLTFISRFTANFNRPVGVAFRSNGNTLYVTDSQKNRVAVFSLSKQ
jgi:DNA-binding beta-propeller fold protein YncE